MGKRTLHGMSYYQCDYTGFPITRAKCYLPYWDLDANKMKKRNHYCNWEAALAHAEMLLHDGVITEHHYVSIVAFVTDKIGGVSLKAAPKASELYHLNQTGCISTLPDFFRACVLETQQIVAVIIKANGELKEENFYVDLGHFDPTPKMEGAAPDDEVCFTHTPRRGGKKYPGKELLVFHTPMRDTWLPANTVATTLFNKKLYGDVVLIQLSCDESELPVERYVPYTLDMFKEEFQKPKSKKRKAPAKTEEVSLAPEEYEGLKAKMEETLEDYERRASSRAKKAGTLARGARCPPASGKELANMVRDQRKKQALAQRSDASEERDSEAA